MIFYRMLFSLAALYNIAFGFWAGLFPQHFFQLFQLPPPLYPSLWACLGMVVGLYGLVYAFVAWKPEQGDALIWIGLVGKILGPIGWLLTIRKGELPARTFFLILCNDLIWWFPFLFYLWRNRAWRGRAIATLVVLFHLAACLGILLMRSAPFSFPPPTLMELDRSGFAWTLGWFFWVLSSISLATFMASWVLTLRRKFLAAPWIWLGFALCTLGVLFDLGGEALFITWLSDSSRTKLEIDWGIRAYTYASAAVANGLYCVAGLMLSVVSWTRKMITGFPAVLGFLLWGVGISLTVTALAEHPAGVMLTAAGTMALFIPWAGWVGWKFKDN